jgi:hypothetical protein
MEQEDARAIRLAKPTAEDLLADLTEQQLDGIRRRVRSGIVAIETGKSEEYEGREGLRGLADSVKTRGRKLLVPRTARLQSSGR